MTLAVPTFCPVAIPEDVPMVITEASLVLHVPPGIASDISVEDKLQKAALPVGAGGSGFTVAWPVIIQPVVVSV